MKNSRLLRSALLGLSLSLFAVSCGNGAKKEDSPEIRVTVAEAKEVLEEKEDLLVLDVRTDAEFQAGALPDAVLIPYDQLEKRIAEVEAYKEKPILLYCRSGNRSAQALAVLEKAGFKEIYHMYQGYSAWN